MRRMAEPKDPRTPGKGLAVLAATLPLLFLLLSCCAVPLSEGSADGVANIAQEAGVWLWAILGAAALGSIVCGILLYASSMGARVPSAVIVLVAALPWVCGIAGTRLSLHTVGEALAFAAPDVRAAIAAQGLAESLWSRMFGGWTAAALLSGVAVGLALGAVNQKAPERRWAAALIGAGAALPLLGLAAVGIAAGGMRVALLVLPALGAIVVGAVGAGAAGKDAPKHRSGALASAGVVAMGVAFLGVAAGAVAVATTMVFGALANVSPESKADMVMMAAAEMAPLEMVARFGGIAVAIAVIPVALWAALRARPSAGRIAGAVALIVIAAGVPALDAFAVRAGIDSLFGMVSEPWEGIDGFEPLALPWGDGARTDVDAVVARGAVRPRLGAPFALGDAALADRFRALIENPGYASIDEPPEPDFIPDTDGSADPSARDFDGAPTLILAPDSRLDQSGLRSLLGAAGQAGARSVVLVGLWGTQQSAGQVDALRESMPMMAPLVHQTATVTLLLESALPAGYADGDAALLHGQVDAGAEVRIEARAGATVSPFVLGDSAHRNDYVDPSEASVVYLALGPGATAGSVAAAAARVREMGHVPLLVVGEMPGHPDAPAALGALTGTEIGDALGLGSLGSLTDDVVGLGLSGTGGPSATTPRVVAGSADVRGSLSREVIRRVIRRHLNEVRFCYEQGLGHSPELAGRVTVSFVISPTGAVVTSTVAESTLGNAAVESCIAQAVRRWAFPAPEGGGIVMVTYPFVLTPDD